MPRKTDITQLLHHFKDGSYVFGNLVNCTWFLSLLAPLSFQPLTGGARLTGSTFSGIFHIIGLWWIRVLTTGFMFFGMCYLSIWLHVRFWFLTVSTRWRNVRFVRGWQCWRQWRFNLFLIWACASPLSWNLCWNRKCKILCSIIMQDIMLHDINTVIKLIMQTLLYTNWQTAKVESYWELQHSHSRQT